MHGSDEPRVAVMQAQMEGARRRAACRWRTGCMRVHPASSLRILAQLSVLDVFLLHGYICACHSSGLLLWQRSVLHELTSLESKTVSNLSRADEMERRMGTAAQWGGANEPEEKAELEALLPPVPVPVTMLASEEL